MRRSQANCLVFVGRTDVGQIFLFADIDGDILIAIALTGDHALVNFDTGTDKERASFLGCGLAVAASSACFVDDQDTAAAAGNLSGVRFIAVKAGIHNAVAAGISQKLGTEAD